MTSNFKKWLSALLALLMVTTPIAGTLAEDGAMEIMAAEEQTEVASAPEPEPAPVEVSPEVAEEQLIPEEDLPQPEVAGEVVEAVEDAADQAADGDVYVETLDAVDEAEPAEAEAAEAEPDEAPAEPQHAVVVAEPLYAAQLDVSGVVNPIYVAYGTPEEALPLPAELPAQLSDGSAGTVSVVWFCTGNTYDGQGYIPECEDREAVFYFQATPVGIDCDPGLILPAVTVMYEPQPKAAMIDHEAITFAGTDMLIAKGSTVTVDDIRNESGYDPSYRIVCEGIIEAGEGAEALPNPVKLSGAIRGGAFDGEIALDRGTIRGGTFNARIESSRGTIYGGTFNGPIGGPEQQIYVSIYGGEFRGGIGDSEYDGYIFVHGGDFYCDVKCRNLTVDGDSTFYNAEGKGGARRTVTLGTVGAIAGGTFYADVLNRNNIIDGTFYGKVTNGGIQKNCNVLGGTFYGEFDNAVGGKVVEYGENGGARFLDGAELSNSSVLDVGEGVTFSDAMVVTNEAGGVIESGNYPCKVVNYGTIAGGNFASGVVNMGKICGGVFDGEMYNEGGTIAGATLNCMLMSNTGEVTLDGLQVDEAAKTVTISAGRTFTTDEILGAIGDDAAGYTVINEGEITAGEKTLPCDFSAGSIGSISGGSFSGAVHAGSISNGSFSGAVNAKTITGGSFNGAVNADSISSGSFSGRVIVRDNITGGSFGANSLVTAGVIAGGTFDGKVTSANREKAGLVTITGGTFNGGVATGPDDGIVINGGTFNCNVGYCADANRNIFDGYVIVRSASGVAEPKFNGSYVGGHNVVTECGVFSKNTKVVMYSSGSLAGGTFHGPVICNNAILGGTFYGEVTVNAQPNGQIHGGTFYGKVNNKEGAYISESGYGGNEPPQFLDGEIENEGVMDPGARAVFGPEVAIVNKASGNIQSGVYNAPVVNYGKISSGVFNAPVTTYSAISAPQATFASPVMNISTSELTIAKGVRTTIAEIKAMNGYSASARIINRGTITGPGELPNTITLIGNYDGSKVQDGVIEGGTFTGQIQSYYGKISGGTFKGNVVPVTGITAEAEGLLKIDVDKSVYSTLVITITGGTFEGAVGQKGTGHVTVYGSANGQGPVFNELVAARNLIIVGGTFNGMVDLSTVGRIEGGEFHNSVVCNNAIMGGEFYEDVTVATAPNGQIFGGVFHGNVINKDNAVIGRDGYNSYGPPQFLGGELSNASTMDPGTETLFAEDVTVVNQRSGNILSGVYRGPVRNYGTISNAVLYGNVENEGSIINSVVLGSISGSGVILVEGVDMNDDGVIVVEENATVQASAIKSMIGNKAERDMIVINKGTIVDSANTTTLDCTIIGGANKTGGGGIITGGNYTGTVYAKTINGGVFSGEVHNLCRATYEKLPAKAQNAAKAVFEIGDLRGSDANNAAVLYGLAINGGTFTGKIGNDGMDEAIFIRGGTFSGCRGINAYNLTIDKNIAFGASCNVSFVVGNITNGTFGGTVTSNNNVTGGTYNGKFVNRGTVYGGTFNGGIDNYGTIDGGVTYDYYKDGWTFNRSTNRWEPKGSSVQKPVTDSKVAINCAVVNYSSGVIAGTVTYGSNYRLDDRGGKIETSALIATPSGESKVYSGAQIVCGASVKKTLAAIDAAERLSSEWSYLSGASIGESATISSDPSQNVFLREFNWDVRDGELQLGMDWSDPTAVPQAEYSSVRILSGATVSGGVWNVPVINEGAITGGTFNRPLTNKGSVRGATINSALTASAGTVEGCTFGASASVASVSGGARVLVKIVAGGSEREVPYGENALSVLNGIQTRSGYQWFSISGAAVTVKSTDTIPLTGGKYELRVCVEPDILWPTASDIGINTPLSASVLTSAEKNGTFRWKYPTMTFNSPCTAQCSVIFTPNPGVTDLKETSKSIPVQVRDDIVTVTVNSSYKYYSSDDPTNWSVKITGCSKADESKLKYRFERDAGEDVGTYKLTVRIIDAPSNWTVKVIPGTLEIRQKELGYLFSTSVPELSYTGEVLNPIPAVRDLLAARSLVYGKDFSVSFDREVCEAGSYVCTITGTGNYRGSVTKEFKVSQGQAVVTVGNYTKYVGDPDPVFTSTCTGVSEKAGFRYELYRMEGERAGTYSILARQLSSDSIRMTLNSGMLRILPLPLPDAITAPAAQSYTGKALTPKPVVRDGGKTLIENTDYTLSYANNTQAGTATVTVTGMGNYSGTRTLSFAINKVNATITANAASKAYGEADPALSATVTGAVSGEKLNYTLSRAAGEAIGTYAISVQLGSNPNYNVTAKGSTLTISIKPLPSTITVPGTQTYTGKALTPKPVVKDGSRTLVEGTDYTLSYANNVQAGTASVTVRSKGNYSGSRTVNFTINKASATVAANAVSKVYGASDPALTAKVTGAVNGEALNYSLSRTSGEAAGSYTISVRLGSNPNYNVTARAGALTIVAKPLPSTITAPAAQSYAGVALTPKPVVKDGAKTLAEGTDYSLSYANNVNAGTASVTVTGKGNYSGVRSYNFAINKVSATIAANAASKLYGAEDPALTAQVTGAVNGETLNYSLSRKAGEDAGTYAIEVKLGSNPNYNVSVQGSALTIDIKPLPATIAAPAAQTYAGKALTPKPVVKDGSRILEEGVDYTLSYLNNEQAGTASVTVTGRGNYSGSHKVEFAIQKAGATVAANAASKLYGTEDPELSAMVTGAVEGEELNYALQRAAGEDAGTYAIEVQLGSNPNYSVTDKAGELTIVAKPLPSTITAPASQVYTGEALTPKPVVKDGEKVLAEGTDYRLSYANNTQAGTASVTVTAMGNYSGARTLNFAIERVDATIEANPASKLYGEDDPELTAKVTGAVNGETLNYSLVRAAGEDAGTYAIEVQLGSNPNYNISVRGSELTIDIKPLPETIAAPAAQTYAGKALTPKPVVKDGEKVLAEGVDYRLSYANNTQAGTASVTVTAEGNYSGERTVDFAIRKASATVAANAASKAYGTADPELSATVTGAVNGETLDYSLSRAEGETLGTYAIDVELGDNPNYDVTAKAGTLTIATQSLSAAITPPANQTYTGEALTPKLVVKDGEKVLVEDVDYTLDYANNVNAGTASITVTGKGNYSGVRTVNFTIEKVEAAIVANPASKLYGAEDPALSANVTGTVNGEALNYTLVRAAGEDAGTYAIDVQLGNNPNYDVAVQGSELTIDIKPLPETITAPAAQTYAGVALTPKPVVRDGDRILAEGVDYRLSYANNTQAGTASVTVTAEGNYSGERTVSFDIRKASAAVAANAASKIYGAADPELSATVTGAVNGETLDYSLSRAEGENVGSYAIDVELGDNPNYDVTAKAGALTIETRPLPEEIAAPAGQTYTGEALTPKPAVEDGEKVLVEDVDYALRYANNVNAGTASVTVTGKGNYSGVRTVNFAIEKAEAEIAASAASKVYGAEDPEFTANVTGAVNGEALNYTLVREAGEDAGTYAIEVQPGSNPNYDVTVLQSALTIEPKPLPDSVTAPAAQTYAGVALTPKPVVKDGDRILEEGVDYALRYDGNVDAGTASVTVIAEGNYSGERTAVFAILKASATVEADAQSKYYATEDPQLTATVTGAVNGETLDYALNRELGEDTGIYAIEVELGDNPNYIVSAKASALTIVPQPLTDEISIPEDQIYAGTALTPKPVIHVGEQTLVEDVDYTLSYLNNVQAGTATMIVTGKDHYTGTQSVNFAIERAEAQVAVNSTFKSIGDEDPEFTAQLTGVATGDRLNYTLSREPGEEVGKYAITVELGDNPNYDVTATGGELEITLDPEEIELSVEKFEVTAGEDIALEYTLLPAGTRTVVTYSSSDDEVIGVDADGRISALKPGIATITATTSNDKEDSCEVVVLPLHEDFAIGKGDKQTLVPSDASVASYSFESSNADVAAVDGKGVVTAKQEGDATITASAYGIALAAWDVKVTQQPDSVTLSDTKRTLGVNEALDLDATIGNGAPSIITWSSSNSKIAAVDADGKVTLKKTGSVKITATTYNKKKATCTLTVKKAATSVKLSVASATLGSGETLALKATLSPKDAASAVTYTSTDEQIARMEDGKIVAGDKTGTATITATIANGGTASCAVTVLSAPTAISLGEDVTLSVGQTLTLNPVMQPSGAKDTVTYKTSNKNFATVTAKGVVKAVKVTKAGAPATITAESYNGVVGSVQITVVAAPSKVKISAAKASLGVGESFALSAEVTGGVDGKVSWKTSSAKIATVDEDGVVNAVKAGTATITAQTYNGKKATCKVTVSAAPTSIELSLKEVTLGAGESTALKATLSKKSAGAITYTSSADEIASVEDGKIVTKAPGEAIITATTYNGLTAECTVTVNAAPTSIELGEDQTLKVNKSLTLAPQFNEGESGSVTYKSSNTKIATVDAKGKVTGKKAGTATITVTTHNGVSDTVTITVKK